MQFGKLEINPAKNPAILDTATWDPVRAWRAIQSFGEAYWQSVQQAIAQDNRLPVIDSFTPYSTSLARQGERAFFLAGHAQCRL